MAKEKQKFTAGEYSIPMLNYLGEDFLRSCVKESDLSVETAQRCGKEVRDKALATIGVLSTFMVALLVAIYSISSPSRELLFCMFLVALVFAYGTVRLFYKIVFEKKNYTGGSTLSYLLHQNVLNALEMAENEEERLLLHLFFQLENKEAACNAIDEETSKMQDSYKETMKTVLILTFSIIAGYPLLCLLNLV